MATVIAAALIAVGTVLAAWVSARINAQRVRKPMKLEHDLNSGKLDYVIGKVDTIAVQTGDTERKLDDHVRDHALGAFSHVDLRTETTESGH